MIFVYEFGRQFDDRRLKFEAKEELARSTFLSVPGVVGLLLERP